MTVLLGLVENSHFCKILLLIKHRKLIKFRGKDFGKSKLEVDLNVNQVEFPEGTTLKSIFLPSSDQFTDCKTAFGEIVFMRHALDFSAKVT